MKDPFKDGIVLLAIATTLVIVFSLIFSVRPRQVELEPSIQWRETQEIPSEA